GVNQHHYVGRPAFLADWSLSGIRTWDCIRAVDYLVSRPEVDTTKLAVTGNSGGGQMALLTAAVDTRIKVVAAAHPGGSMENTYLTGQTLTDRDVLCLIPPRPCRMIVGDASGEQEGHMKKLDDMARFYRGLGVDDDHWDMDIVDGVHDMKQPKRESAYEWLNLWFDKVEEGKEEPVLNPEDPKALWCTENGNTLKDLGGESGQTLNQKRAEQIYNPAKNPEELKKNILSRLHLKIPANESPSVNRREFFTENNISVEKFTYTVEKNIEIPSVLLRPVDIKERKQLIFHIFDKGKPDNFKSSPLIFALVRAGFPILSIDVRGTGETATLPPVGEITRFTGYTPDKWKYERLAIQSASFRRTMDGMRALDVIKGIDLVKSRDDLKDKSVIMLGEGSGGIWALLGNICRSDVQGVITLYTLPSYKFLIAGKYYDLHGYFWVPGALRDYDIPDLVNLADPNRQLWINPVNELSEVISSEQLFEIIPKFDGIKIITAQHEETDVISKKIIEFIDSDLK
ncbi:MAG: acetylxylan esterase, partial [Prolixibacteraceae bacterium]|nr:acetylxylan esterase [Prolixibacteraceae bacterium]